MRLLQELGYTHVRDMHGGIAEWNEAGLPIESGEERVIPAIPVPARAGDGRGRWSPLEWVSRRSIGGLLWTWILINLGCGLVYWMISFLPGH